MACLEFSPELPTGTDRGVLWSIVTAVSGSTILITTGPAAMRRPAVGSIAAWCGPGVVLDADLHLLHELRKHLLGGRLATALPMSQELCQCSQAGPNGLSATGSASKTASPSLTSLYKHCQQRRVRPALKPCIEVPHGRALSPVSLYSQRTRNPWASQSPCHTPA